MLVAEAWVRTPSIVRTETLRPIDVATRSAAPDSPCLGSGSTAKALVSTCIGRLSVMAGTGFARYLGQIIVVCWGGTLPTIVSEVGRALEPMLPH